MILDLKIENSPSGDKQVCSAHSIRPLERIVPVNQTTFVRDVIPLL